MRAADENRRDVQGRSFGTLGQIPNFDGMSERTKACLRKAADCERAAVLATAPALQAMYRELARQWRDMAEQSKELEQRRPAAKERQPNGPITPGSRQDWTSS